MDNLSYKNYLGSVEYSKSDNCLVGHVLGLTKVSITYEGESLQELEEDFKAGVDSYLEGCAEHGITPQKTYSGYLNLRIPSELHGQVSEFAKSTGQPINTIIRKSIEYIIKNKILL